MEEHARVAHYPHAKGTYNNFMQLRDRIKVAHNPHAKVTDNGANIAG